jgi:Smg protein
MIDILVYLFENYQPDACPAPTVLAKKLTAAGFEADDISAALVWLEGLTNGEQPSLKVSDTRAIRIFDEAECARLTVEARGFLAFLEAQEAIDAGLRETIIDRAMALPGNSVSVERLKVIVLAVVWRRQHAIDALILEELLADDSDEDDEYDGIEVEPQRVLLN